MTERKKEYMKEYREKNKNKLKEQEQNYRNKHKERKKIESKEKSQTLKGKFSSYKCQAKVRKIILYQ